MPRGHQPTRSYEEAHKLAREAITDALRMLGSRDTHDLQLAIGFLSDAQAKAMDMASHLRRGTTVINSPDVGRARGLVSFKEIQEAKEKAS